MIKKKENTFLIFLLAHCPDKSPLLAQQKKIKHKISWKRRACVKSVGVGSGTRRAASPLSSCELRVSRLVTRSAPPLAHNSPCASLSARQRLRPCAPPRPISAGFVAARGTAHSVPCLGVRARRARERVSDYSRHLGPPPPR